MEKLRNQTGVTPEVKKRENHVDNNEEDPSQYKIHVIRSVGAALSLNRTL